MNKRERLEATIHGQPVDRTPVALWQHFPGDDQGPADLATATIAFQRRWDFDFVKVRPASSFCVRDWDAEDEWIGNIEGTRDYTRHPIRDPRDWLSLKPLDPCAGLLGDQLRCLSAIRADLPDVPIIQTIFNPLSQAKNLVGPDLAPMLHSYPGEVRRGLETIAATMIEFIHLCCSPSASASRGPRERGPGTLVGNHRRLPIDMPQNPGVLLRAVCQRSDAK